MIVEEDKATIPNFFSSMVEGIELDRISKQIKKKFSLGGSIDTNEFLENEFWLILKNMGFKQLNKDKIEIQIGSTKKQISIFAVDNNNIFIIDCIAKYDGDNQDIFLTKRIHEILRLKNSIISSIKKIYKNCRISFLIVTRHINWSSENEIIINDNRKNNIFFFRDTDIDAFKSLTNQLGEGAKSQFYSILFRGKKIFELEKIKVPAILGGKGKNKYYVFIIQPEKLLNGTVYIHRREKSDPEELSGTYQRMIKKSRLKNIHNFIEKGGFFPNNIIINFTKLPRWEKKSEIGEITFGILKFPPYYGSAWIIDGQHRLYGYSKTKRKLTDTIPVVAFQSLNTKKQANIFVEINKKQKAVSSNLLWDLYPDIYEGAEDDESQTLRCISLIVKKLNSDPESVFHRHINIPSNPEENKKLSNLTLANICDGFLDNKLISREDGILFEKNYDNTIDYAYERLKIYFDVLYRKFPEDWKKGENGLLRTNIGIRIFLVIFRQFLRYLKYEDPSKIRDLLEFKKKSEFILDPVVNQLKEMSHSDRDKIRGESNKRLILVNSQKLLWGLKEKLNFGLELWRKGGWTPDIPEEERSEQKIKKLIDDSEVAVRNFIIQEIQKIHSDRWWIDGIPEGVKCGIQKVIDVEITNFPWRKEELNLYTPEQKKIFMSPAHLKEIIINKKNWKQFEPVFAKDKEIVSTSFRYFESIRNKYKHPERDIQIDDIEKGLGYWNIKWIRRCIGLDTKKIAV